MLADVRKKAVVYKLADFGTATPPQLATLVGQALAHLGTTGSRRERVSPEDEAAVWRLVGQTQIDGHYVFGVLMRYAPGTNAVFVVDDAQAKQLTVEQMIAPANADGKKRELLNSLLYFGILQNHVVVMQSGLRTNDLEDHLAWLLKTANLLGNTAAPRLVDQPPKATRARMEQKNIKALTFGGGLGDDAPVAVPVANAPLPGERAAMDVALDGDEADNGMWQVLKKYLKTDQAAKLDLEALKDSNIQYSLRVTYNRKTTGKGHALLNTLGAALRHSEDLHTVLELEGGGKIKGNELRITGTVPVTYIGGVPDALAIFTAMGQWVTQRITNDDIK